METTSVINQRCKDRDAFSTQRFCDDCVLAVAIGVNNLHISSSSGAADHCLDSPRRRQLDFCYWEAVEKGWTESSFGDRTKKLWSYSECPDILEYVRFRRGDPRYFSATDEFALVWDERAEGTRICTFANVSEKWTNQFMTTSGRVTLCSSLEKMWQWCTWCCERGQIDFRVLMIAALFLIVQQ